MGGQVIGNYVLCIVIVVLILFSYDDKLTEIVYILQNATAPCHNIFFVKSCHRAIQAGIYLVKVNNRNTRTRCEICSEFTIKTPERRQWRRSAVFLVNFENISHLAVVFLSLTFIRQMPAGMILMMVD